MMVVGDILFTLVGWLEESHDFTVEALLPGTPFYGMVKTS